MAVFKITPRTQKEKTRVAEHGDVWQDTQSRHVKLPQQVLLESCKTAHLRWWAKDQITLL